MSIKIKIKIISTVYALVFSYNISAKNIIPCGTGSQIIESKKLFRGKYVTEYACVNEEGKLNGGKHIYYKDSLIDKCDYINGLAHGVCSSWYFTGEKYYTNNFNNGFAQGESIMWHRNGVMKYWQYYENSKPAGIWKVWNEKGELIEIWDRK